MKSEIRKIKLVFVLSIVLQMISSGQKNKAFEALYPSDVTTDINQDYTKSYTLNLFKPNETLFSLTINARIKLNGCKSLARVILETEIGEELLVMESYYILSGDEEIIVSDYGEETILLNGIIPKQIKVELEDATIHIESISYNNSFQNKTKDTDFALFSELIKKEQDSIKIEKISTQIKKCGYSWQANKTSISRLTYQQKMHMFGNPLPNLRGFEYYSGGVFDLTEPKYIKSASLVGTCSIVPSFDWRNRHGKNWMTPVRNQGAYGTCPIFSATGATEAFINLYYNQLLNLDLAEQKPVKCIGWSTVQTLNYYTNTGAVLESCAPYDPGNSQDCDDVCPNPTEILKIGGKIYLRDVAVYPFTEEGYKKMIIKYGPIASGVVSMNHNMTLVGFYTRSTDGKTVWIFKNSWGNYNNLGGYCEIITDVSDLWGGYAPISPVTSLIYNEGNRLCNDYDGDGYYYWGIGTKPSTCPTCPNEEDGDDSNSNLGPINDFGYCTHLVRTNQTWQSTYNENADVMVKNGGNLTLNGAIINLGCDSSFSVELGGILTFNSGTIQ